MMGVQRRVPVTDQRLFDSLTVREYGLSLGDQVGSAQAAGLFPPLMARQPIDQIVRDADVQRFADTSVKEIG